MTSPKERSKEGRKEGKNIFIECLLCSRHTVLIGHFLSIPKESCNSYLHMRLKKYKYNMSNLKIREVEELKILTLFFFFVVCLFLVLCSFLYIIKKLKYSTFYYTLDILFRHN